jgi:hypothetical protein
MPTALKIAYLWHDGDVVQVRITVENAEFRGTADVYVGTDGLFEAAARLAGFPANNLDKREAIFGAAGKQFAGGFVRLEFYCEGGAGHATFRATVEADYRNRELAESSVVHVSFEPAALDAFLPQLQQVEREHRGFASLVTAP